MNQLPLPDAQVAYFSMEIGLEPAIPTYAGGLGVLSGDTLRAAADLELPIVGVSLVHREGYFRQHLDESGHQTEETSPWHPEERLTEMPARVKVAIEGRDVELRCWLYRVRGVSGYEVPVFLLDALLPSNDSEHQRLTDRLYGGDARYRLCQEALLGIGGVAMLRALGFDDLRVYHMNEGHSSLLALALLERESGRDPASIDAVRRQCVFTTHTPVPAGHDQFPLDLCRRVLGGMRTEALESIGCTNRVLNMTYLGLFFSRYVNGVALRHGEISRGMFPQYPIASITNGVHAATWTAPALREVFDRYVPDWRQQNENLRYAVAIPLFEIQEAHRASKRALIAEVERRTHVHLDEGALTLGFARRATPYKRADLLLSEVGRLVQLSRSLGRIQIVYAGKAHPGDRAGTEMIRRVFDRAASIKDDVPIIYIEDYDMSLGAQLCAGVDLWINSPQKPNEASGTSGMKAALNGVPSLSVLDGWWIEGHVEGVTGWSIGESSQIEPDPAKEVASLYQKLEEIAVMFFGRPETFGKVMRYAIALNGSFFNSQRMVEQYAESAYHLKPRAE